MKKKTYWHKLDNAAKIFPAVSKDNRSNVFRLSFHLYEDIDPEILNHAVEETLNRFQLFDVQLKNGIFWNYFSENKNRFEVEKENFIICKYFKFSKNKGFLFKVYYLKNKISLETFHSISDGTGAMYFLKTLVYKYLVLKGYTIDHENQILGELPHSNNEDIDAFVKNYDPKNKKNLQEQRAYHLKGETFNDHWNMLIKVKVDTKQMISLIKEKYGVSLTQFLTAAIAYSIYEEGVDAKGSKKPIKMFIPVNLRPYFNESTLRNFALYIKTTYDLTNKWTFEEMLEQTKIEFKEQLIKEELHQRLSSLVSLEKNVFIRVLPLFLKTLAFKIGYNSLGESINTMSLSNLGKIDLPNDMIKHVKDIDFITGGKLINTAVCSYQDSININFISTLKDISVIRYFVQILRKENIDVVIDTNYQEGYDEIL